MTYEVEGSRAQKLQGQIVNWIHAWGPVVILAAVVLVMFSGSAWASGTGMPWEDTLDDILQSLQGPVARFVGIVAILITGLLFALGEGGGWFKRGMGIAMGLAIAFSATTFVQTLGFAGGAAF